MNVFQKIKAYIDSNGIIANIEKAKKAILILQSGTIFDRQFKKCAIEALIESIDDDKPELIDELYEEFFGDQDEI